MGLTRAMMDHGLGSHRYREALIPSGDMHIVLSVWEAEDTSAPVLVFMPGTMTHPLVYAECLDNLADRGTTVVGVPLELLADLLTFDTRPITSGTIRVPLHV